MNEAMTFTVAPTLTAPTAAIKRVEPKLLTDCSKCEGNNHVAFFGADMRGLNEQCYTRGLK